MILRQLAGLLLLVAACEGGGVLPAASTFDGDDPPQGDSLNGATFTPEDREKADLYTVPKSLTIDKNKKIYLTFNDGPSRNLTPKILDCLLAQNVQATFFVTGERIAGNEDILRRQRDEGHTVANHLWKHQGDVELAQFTQWFDQQAAAMTATVGKMPCYFRYPGGTAPKEQEDLLKQRGCIDGGVGWDMDSLDWNFGPSERATRNEIPEDLRTSLVEWVVHQAKQVGGGVILFHDVQSITASRLCEIIPRLKAEGFTFAQLPRLQQGAPANGYIGESCRSDADCNYEGGVCLRPDARPDLDGYCTRPCTGTCANRPGRAPSTCVQVAAPNGAPVSFCAASCEAQSGCRAGTSCKPLGLPGGTTKNICF
jgi:peptidoglycan/xylan/chitin deacetylase (PgdA/CDA1 family)